MMINSFEAVGLTGIRVERVYQLASSAEGPSNRVHRAVARRIRRAANHPVHPSPSIRV